MPGWVTSAYLILAPIITVWMVIRIIKRRRAEREQQQADSLPLSPATSAVDDQLTQTAATDLSEPASVPDTVAAMASSVRRDDEATASELADATSGFPPQPEAVQTASPFDSGIRESLEPIGLATVGGVGVGRSWEHHTLFGSLAPTTFDDGNDIPQVEPEHMPSLDGSGYVFGSVTPMLAEMLPESDERAAASKKELVHAGFYNPHARQNFKAIRYLGIMLPLLLLGAGLAFGPPALELPMLAGIVVLPVLGWALPRIYLQNKARDRRSEIEGAMPDMLDMLNMCVSQGLTVVHSMGKVGRELKPIYPAMSQELNIVADQAELGTLPQALENLNKRVDVPEVHSFSALMIQTGRMGTSVSQALIEYSDNMRETLRQRADSRSNRSTFRLLFPTVLCLMPAVFMFLLGPAIVDLSKFFSVDGGSAVLRQGRDSFQQFNQQQGQQPGQ
ncbi:MAG: type II secretion system F family protein [Planctomycetota bacterium]|nr:type II secretion system F family protein [Planctomycetota bacterium]